MKAEVRWGSVRHATLLRSVANRLLKGITLSTMDVSFAALPTLDALRAHVHQVLCSHDCLDPIQAPLHQAVVSRKGKPCGLFFQIQGPRLLKTHAVWASEEDRILFYDSQGLRFAETKLSDAPDAGKLAA